MNFQLPSSLAGAGGSGGGEGGVFPTNNNNNNSVESALSTIRQQSMGDSFEESSFEVRASNGKKDTLLLLGNPTSPV